VRLRFRRAPRLATAAALFLALITLLGFVASPASLFEMLAQFRPQLAAASVVLILAALLAQRRLAAVIALAAFLANLAPLAPYLNLAAVARPASGPAFRVLTLNLHGDPRTAEKFRALVAAQNPDIILLTELPWSLDAFLGELAAAYPNQIVDRRRHSGFDVALFTRWNVKARNVDRSVSLQVPVLSTELCDPSGEAGSCLTLIGLHAARPFGLGADVQAAQFALARRLADAAKTPILLVGDLNMTPWAPSFHQLVKTLSLSDSAAGHPLTGTWFARNPLLGLPIDHILAGPGIKVLDYHVGADVGSDHFPVIASLALGAYN